MMLSKAVLIFLVIAALLVDVLAAPTTLRARAKGTAKTQKLPPYMKPLLGESKKERNFRVFNLLHPYALASDKGKGREPVLPVPLVDSEKEEEEQRVHRGIIDSILEWKQKQKQEQSQPPRQPTP